MLSHNYANLILRGQTHTDLNTLRRLMRHSSLATTQLYLDDKDEAAPGAIVSLDQRLQRDGQVRVSLSGWRNGWRSMRVRMRIRTVMMLAIAAMASGCGSGSTPVAQQRSDLTSFYNRLSHDLGRCNASIGVALIDLGLYVKQQGTAVDGDLAARQAREACKPESNNDILDLGTTQIPDSLTDYGLSDARSDLEVWASYASDAMGDLDKLFQNGNDVGAGADYKDQGSKMASSLAGAQQIFNSAAKKAGATLKPLELAALQ
jgi:hypothetical protein